MLQKEFSFLIFLKRFHDHLSYLLLEYLYEPTQGEILQQILPKHLNAQMWKVLLDSNAAEHAARMTAMENATQNAKDLIEELVLQRNRARQTLITKEVAEIVSGAEASGAN